LLPERQRSASGNVSGKLIGASDPPSVPKCAKKIGNMKTVGENFFGDEGPGLRASCRPPGPQGPCVGCRAFSPGKKSALSLLGRRVFGLVARIGLPQAWRSSSSNCRDIWPVWLPTRLHRLHSIQPMRRSPKSRSGGAGNGGIQCQPSGRLSGAPFGGFLIIIADFGSSEKIPKQTPTVPAKVPFAGTLLLLRQGAVDR
jgi:hypothetical protein